MARPDEQTVVKWRELAEAGYLYAEIAQMYPDFSVDQIRHYCLGHTGQDMPGPIPGVDGAYGSKGRAARRPSRSRNRKPIREPPRAGQTPQLGYLYVLSNPSLDGLYKVGKTARDPHERARQLSSTGLPTPFEVEWVSLPLSGVDAAEREAHERLSEFRASADREFFELDLDWLASVLEEIEAKFRA